MNINPKFPKGSHSPDTLRECLIEALLADLKPCLDGIWISRSHRVSADDYYHGITMNSDGKALNFDVLYTTA